MDGIMPQALVKVDRANDHIHDLIEKISEFRDTEPCGIRKEFDLETRQLYWYADRVSEIPICIPLIAGDVLNNLRSALDHLVYALVAIGSG
jgi:hypothetical protein